MEFAVGDHVVEIIDGHSFPVALKNAVEVKWSGILSAMKDSQQVGVVVLRDGHVAWAVSNAQTENFGSFLERIGMVPKEKLDEVIQKYRSLGKSKKLGALLEETGLISHSTLRECLKAHVRAAISSMLADPGIILQAKGGEMVVDTSLIFLLGEVYPEPHEEVAPDGSLPVPDFSDAFGQKVEPQPEEQVFLQDLSTLPGYLYSLVSNIEGNLLACHLADGVPVDTKHVLQSLLDWLGASSRCSNELGMGNSLFEFVQSEKGSLFVHLVDTESRFFLAVACDEKAKLGVVRHKMSELMPEVKRLTEMQ
jgi:predicted regulator of Ras-like GTPase activity (Roadblock/LC7/MglB family)